MMRKGQHWLINGRVFVVGSMVGGWFRLTCITDGSQIGCSFKEGDLFPIAVRGKEAELVQVEIKVVRGDL